MTLNMSRAFILLLAAYGVGISCTYFSVLKWLVENDWIRADYSHCYLIPFAAAYLIWEKCGEFRAAPSRPTWMGLISVVAATACFWLGELAGEFFVMYLSFWLMIIGLCWIHLGWDKLRIIGFPLTLLLTMFPLPHFVNNQVTVKLKLLSSQLGVHCLQLWGMAAYREGNIIDIGYTQLQVVDACSGLRYLIPLMVLGLILAYWFKAPLWKRAILFFSTVPLAIAVNALRIAATGVLYVNWGADVAEGFFHGFSGWLIFMCTTAVLWGEVALLKRIPTRVSPQRPGQGLSDSMCEGPSVLRSGVVQMQENRSLPMASVMAILLLMGSLALSHGVEFRQGVSVKKSFEAFPAQVAEWYGARQQIEEEVLRELDLSTYLLIDYTNREGIVVNFYTAYYESQRKGASIHSPSTCMPGSGWVFHESGWAEFPLDDSVGEKMRVNRASMEKDSYKQLVYYWFPMRGRILTEAYELKLYNFWDALTKQRTDGALVRLVTPIYDGEEPGRADARLQAFARQVVPILSEHLPGK